MRASRLAGAAAVFGAWTLVGLLSIAPNVLAQLAGEGRPVRIKFVAMIFESVWLWAAFTPGIWWLARRLPITRQRFVRRVVLHLAIGVALNVVDCAVDRLIQPLLGVIHREPFATALREDLFINVFSYVATVICGQALAHAALARERQLRETQLQAELARAQLRALEMQLRPHFLFNALHSIGALISQQENRTALRTVAELGDLLRAMLRGDGDHEATVHEELELTLRYLRIEEVRFHDRLETHVSVTPEALPARVPRLVLQPLVENAVRHGVEAATGPARIDLRASVEDGMVWLSVRDDGRADTRHKGQGIGLTNTRARLERLYGDRHRLELVSADGGGIEARVGVPFHVGPIDPAGGAS